MHDLPPQTSKTTRCKLPLLDETIVVMTWNRLQQHQQPFCRHLYYHRVVSYVTAFLVVSSAFGNFGGVLDTDFWCTYPLRGDDNYGNHSNHEIQSNIKLSYYSCPQHYDDVVFQFVSSYTISMNTKNNSVPTTTSPATPLSSIAFASTSNINALFESNDTTGMHERHVPVRQEGRKRQELSQHQPVNVTSLLDDINYNVSGICGAQKCMFYSRSNTSVGYLIPKVKMGNTQKSWNNTLQGGYSIAQELFRDFPQIPHFYHLGPPLYVSNLSKRYAGMLNSNVPIVLKQFEDGERQKRASSRQYIPDLPTFIQPLLVAPTENALIGCSNKRYNATIENLLQFITNHVLLLAGDDLSVAPPSVDDKSEVSSKSSSSTTLTSQSTSAPLKIFYDNLEQDIHIVEHSITNTSKYDCLLYDFQFLVSTEGKLSHVDLDRCYNNEGEKNAGDKYGRSRESCFANVGKMMKHIRAKFAAAQ